MKSEIRIAGIRVCSKSKNPNISPGSNCLLKDLYTNTNIKGFFRKLKALKIPYYVLSRKHGICWEGKHNTAYSSTEHLTDEKLLELLKIQSKKSQNIHFIYYNHRPLTHNKWVKLLMKAGFRVSCVQRLEEYNKFAKNQQKNLISILNEKRRSEIIAKK